MHLTKDNIRSSLLKKRGQLSKQEQQNKSEKIINNIKKGRLLDTAKKIAIYHAVRKEADPYNLVNIKNLDSQVQFYLPVLSKNKMKNLLFAPIGKNTLFKNNEYMIPEPIVEDKYYLAPEELDIVIMPLVAFDLSGNRLGMGGGYYDRCFAFKKSKTHKPTLVGFAYDFQQVEFLDIEPWDIGLDAIATESQLISITI